MEKRRYWSWIAATVVVVVVGWGVGWMAQAAAQPGSADDPLVSKSYVDALFASLGGQLPNQGALPPGSLAIETPVLKKGQKLIGAYRPSVRKSSSWFAERIG